MEAVISILLLVILLTTITAMIQTSRQTTARSMQIAETVQEVTFNDVFNTSHAGYEPGEVTFTSTAIIIRKGDPINAVSHDAFIFDNPETADMNTPTNIIAFYPDR